MGVLDDAIREHLELKRAHGAAEEEIARKEAEALGPARRGPAPDADAPVEAAPLDETPPPAAGDVEPAPAALDDEQPTSMADAAAALGEVGQPAPVEPEVPVAETEALPPDEDVAPPPVEPTIDVPAEVEPPGAIEPGRPEPGATQEFDTLSARDEAPAADEDVLEETPEFLRETPEHDRLWFEQKPPRDFDLDE
jgi:hypothetical protein